MCSALIRTHWVGTLVLAVVSLLSLSCEHKGRATKAAREAAPDLAPPSLAQKLQQAIDPLDPQIFNRTLSERLCPVADDVELSGVVGYVHPEGKLPGLRQYEDFHEDADLVFNLRLDEPSKTKLLGLKYFGKDLPKLDSEGNVHCELVPFARAHNGPSQTVPVFPAWLETGTWSVRFDGAPFWTTESEALTRWQLIKAGTKVTVRGALVVDLVGSDQVEIHPVYEIQLTR